MRDYEGDSFGPLEQIWTMLECGIPLHLAMMVSKTRPQT